MSRIRKSMVALFAVAAMAISSSTAQAAFQLRLTAYDLSNNLLGSIVVTDQILGATGDFNNTAGVLLHSGSVGNFTVNTITGTSKPFLGTGSPIAHMDLNSFNATSSSLGGKLLIELTDTGFGATGVGVFSGAIGGTVNSISTSSLTVNAYKSNSNVEFDTSNLAAQVNMGTFASGAFSSTVSSNHGVIGNPYSITLTAWLVHSGSGNTSFDFDTFNTPVPEPATVISAVLGLPMLVGYGLRRRRLATKSVA